MESHEMKSFHCVQAYTLDDFRSRWYDSH